MKRLRLFSLLLLALVAFQTPAALAGDDRSVFINMTNAEDLHAASMALSLASNAQKLGFPVYIFLNVHAAKFADANLPKDVKYADFPPVKDMLAEIMAKGGTVFVCSHCAQVVGVSKDKIAKGMIPADHADFLMKLPREGDILSFTY